MNKIYIIGIGPGSKSLMTHKAVDAIAEAQVVIFWLSADCPALAFTK